MRSSLALVVCFGDLPSLVAASIQPALARLLVWFPEAADPRAARRLERTRAMARALSVREVITVPAVTLGIDHDPAARGMERSAVMLQAVALARRGGAGRVVWPEHQGPRADALLRSADRACLVGMLAQIEGRDQPVPELPLLDLDDRRVVDLADDVGAPADCFWPCEGAGRDPCGACSSCRRWREAHDAAGVAWPWETGVRVTDVCDAGR